MVRFLVIMAINVIITLVLNPIFVIMMVGGALGGGGAAALFHFHDERGTRKRRTAYWQIAGASGYSSARGVAHRADLTGGPREAPLSTAVHSVDGITRV